MIRVFYVLLLVAFSLLATTPNAHSAVWHVQQGGGGDFESIQPAIETAVTGDEIIVGPGTYLENLSFLGKDLYLRSEAGPGLTIIDGSSGDPGEGSCVLFENGETEAAILEGFTLTGGHGHDYGGLHGGGLICWFSQATVRDCHISGNSAEHGAAAYVGYGALFLENCWVEENVPVSGREADDSGRSRGIMGEYASFTFRDCTFINNPAGALGGLQCECLIEDCHFENTSVGPADGTYRNCVFIDVGGTLSGHLNLEGCLFVRLWSDSSGGAVELSGGVVSGCTFYQCAADRYSGGVLLVAHDDVVVENCIIIATPVGYGINNRRGGTYLCNNVWDNAEGNYKYEDPTGQDGNISVDPLFCDPENDDLTLQSDSPCAEENNPECGQIGVYGVGCEPPTPAAWTSWGRLKRLFTE